MANLVLCVDDDSTILRLHKRLLEDAGYAVLTAASGAEALSLLEQGTPVEAAVLDYLMPGMNGKELVVHLRQRYPQLRLIAVSGNELPPAMRVSVDGHLLKGGQPEEIVSVLKAILDGSNRGREDDQEDPLVEGTILCVEDKDLQLQARRSLLESAGFQVFGARTSKAAMEIFQANHVDAVLMDYWLSGTNGTALAERMKQIRPGIPILMFSGFTSLPGEGAVVDAWLRKGQIEPEDLIRAIKRAIALHCRRRRVTILE